MSKPSIEEQKNQVKEIMEFAEMKLNDVYVILPFKWWQMWTEYVGYDGEKVGNTEPGIIDSSEILDDEGKLRKGLTENYDFYPVLLSVGHLFIEWYGSKSELIKKKVVYGPNKALKLDIFPLTLKYCTLDDDLNLDSTREIDSSRYWTIKQLIFAIAAQLFLAPSRVRLWLKNGDKLEDWELIDKQRETLQIAEFGLVTDGSEFIVESKDQEEDWLIEKKSNSGKQSYESENIGRSVVDANPMEDDSSAANVSDRTGAGEMSIIKSRKEKSASNYYSSSWSSHSEGSPISDGICGLRNLGNTCFMNSGLQCLMSAVPLSDFFISDNYVKDVNESNPLGTGGKLVKKYADLVKNVYSGKYKCVSPDDFKRTLGNFAQQFSGYNQQDSQELLAYLMDGLHEDLNRVINKPYVEGTESNGRDDEIVAKEFWEGHLKRNQSVIVDHFQAQLKSTVCCPNCDRVSITFDPYLYLSVPVPISQEKTVPVTFVFSDPNKVPRKLNVNVNKQDSIKELRLAVSVATGVPPEKIAIVDMFYHRIYQIFEDNKSISSIRMNDIIYGYQLESYPPQEVTNTQQQVNTTTTENNENNQVEENKENATEENKENGENNKEKKEEEQEGPKFIQVTNSRKGKYSGQDLFSHPFILTLLQPGKTTGKDVYDRVFEYVSKRYSKPQISKENIPFTIHLINQARDDLTEENKINNDENLLNFSKKGTLGIFWQDIEAFDEEVADKTETESSGGQSGKDDSQINVYSCLEKFSAKETLTEENLWYCSQCKEHRAATKQVQLWSLPDILVIHFKRFQYNKYWRDKIDQVIDFPVEGLDMSKFVVQPTENSLYDLFAVSEHYGGMGGGHYTAKVKGRNNQWYSCDDSSTSPTSPSSTISSAAYVLFYRRRGTNSNNSSSSNTNTENNNTNNENNTTNNTNNESNGKDDMDLNDN
eukprot:TRINITY_DN781_c0_g1_i1.p1 TRINITY_DN781_c0_g1~~TRINITY_DN781_c0_g1_i1.p1  ORF type:complete len:934 (-),score=338.84 TRINITY_DN781_c0_g1_i1:16-2817(-)